MGSFAADHLVADEAAFVATVRAAIEGARAGRLMTVGITPTHPETSYGYIHLASADGLVGEFVEKPPYERAVEYVGSGDYLWNASMFVWRVDVFLAELARQQPEMHAGLLRIAQSWDTDAREDVLGEVWPTLPKVAVDYAVMEGAAAAGLVGTVPGTFGWTDVGDFHTLGDVLPADDAGNVVLDSETKGEVVLHDAERVVVVPRSGRLVAAVGVHDLVIVDTDDAVLVCSRERAQDVKKIVDALKERGAATLL
jgi:mannose-1-phosphate guanylyltransferase